MDSQPSARYHFDAATEHVRDVDLKDIMLVDRAEVRFLADVEVAGTEVVNCSEYTGRWIAGEKQSQ